MFTSRFGIEIEFTGITRNEAAKVAADYLNGTVTHTGDYYDTKKVTAPDGRVWKFMSDSSISCQKKQGRQKVTATRDYSVELVSPILTTARILKNCRNWSDSFATLVDLQTTPAGFTYTLMAQTTPQGA
jgi:hypothetical protein